MHRIDEPGAGGAAPKGAGAGGGGGIGEGAFARRHGQGRRRRWHWVALGALLLLIGAAGLAAFVAIFGVHRVRRADEVEIGTSQLRDLALEQAALVRLAATPVLEWKGSDPELGLAFREIFDIKPEVAQTLAFELQSASDEYRQLESEHATYEILGPSSGRVTIAPFAAEVEALTNRVRGKLVALLPLPASSVLQTRQVLSNELFLHGRDTAVYELRSNAADFSYARVGTGDAAPWMTSEKLPAFLERHWNKMFRRLSPSAQPAFARFLAEMAALDPTGERIEVRALETDQRGSDDEPRMLLRAELFLPGEAIAATALLNDFYDRLKELDGVNAGLGETHILSDGSGVAVSRFQVVFEVQDPFVPLCGGVGGAGAEDRSPLLRAISREAGIGEINITPRDVSDYGDCEDIDFVLRPPKVIAHLDEVLRWAERLETGDDASVVRELGVWLKKPAPDAESSTQASETAASAAWNVQVVVRARQGA